MREFMRYHVESKKKHPLCNMRHQINEKYILPEKIWVNFEEHLGPNEKICQNCVRAYGFRKREGMELTDPKWC